MWKAQVFWEEQENVLRENWSDTNQHLPQHSSLNPTLQPLGFGAGFGAILATSHPLSHLSTLMQPGLGARLRDLIFSKVHGQHEVGTFLAPNPSALGHWDPGQSIQLSTHFGKDSCPCITSRQLSNTPRMETHGGSGLDSPSPPPNPLGIPSLFGDVIPLLSPRAATQGSSGAGMWKDWGETLPPQNTTITFHITWVTAQKCRGSGKAIVSDRSK